MKKYILLALAFAAILGFIFQGFIFDESKLMLNSDQLNGLGVRYLRAEHIIMPQWDNSRLGGVPTLDAMFGDVYHPLVTMHWLMDPARAVGFKFILCVFISFLSALALFRKLSGKWEWAALLAFLYALNPQLFTHIYGGHDGKMMVFSVAPLAILGLIQIIRDGNARGMILLSLSIVYMILSSHIQLTYFFLWGAGLFTLFEIFRLPLHNKQRASRLGLAALGLAIALGITSFQIIPPYKYTTTESVRNTGEKKSIGHAVSWSLHQEELTSMLVPGFLQADINQERTYWGHNSFKLNHDTAGVLLTFLAFLGLFVMKNRRSAIFWFVGSGVALSYALGAHSPLFQLWYNILPGVKSFRAPSMAIFWIPLAMGMMAVPVLEALKDKEARAKLIPGVLLFVALVLVATIARFNWDSVLGAPGAVIIMIFGFATVAVLNLQDRAEKFSIPGMANAWIGGLKGSNKLEMAVLLLPFILVAWVFLSAQSVAEKVDTAPYFQMLNLDLMSQSAATILPSVFVILLVVGVSFFIVGSTKTLWMAALGLAIVGSIDLFMVNIPFVQNIPREQYWQPENPIIKTIQQDSPDALNRPRVLSVSRNPAISGNIFPAYGLRHAMGFHDNELATYREFRGGPGSDNLLDNIQDNPFLNLLNIGYVIFDSQEGTRVVRNSFAMPFATLYGAYKVVPVDSVQQLLKSGFDYRRIALLHEAPQGLPPEALAKSVQIPPTADSTLAAIMNQASLPRTVNGSVKLIDRSHMDIVTLEVDAQSAAFLMVSENYHPYWKALVDGKEAPLVKAFGTLRGVVVPAGKHTVVMKYESEAIALSLKISLISAIIFLLAIGIIVVKKRKVTAK